jgi:DNA-binding transcriptional MerR regulator
MIYTIHELVELTGIAPRTIRDYIERGLAPRPEGVGPAAVYGEEHLVRLQLIVHLRARGAWKEQLAKDLPRWSLARCRRVLAAAEAERVSAEPSAPAPTPGASEPAAPDATPVLEGEPVSTRPRLPPRAARHLERRTANEGSDLPEVPRWRVLPLLPQLALVLRDDASPVVRRIAAEIYQAYGAGN